MSSVLVEGRYSGADRQRDGVLRSVVIPGFAVPVRALFDDEANLTSLRLLLLQA